MAKYSVEMRCEIIKVVEVECDSEEEARNNPFEFATNEYEKDVISSEVIEVTEL